MSVAHWYNTHVAMSYASIYCVGLGITLLLIFATQMRSVLRSTGSKGPWANGRSARASSSLRASSYRGRSRSRSSWPRNNREYAIAKLVNFFSQNNELVIMFGICLLTLTTGLAILLGRSPASLPKNFPAWYSIVVAVVATLGPLAAFAFAFGFPIWLIATGFVVATKQRRGTLASSSSDVATAASSSSASQLVTT